MASRSGRRIGPYLPGLPDALGYLPVECWCRRKIVHVKPEDIKAGLTGSCGRANCRPPRRGLP